MPTLPEIPARLVRAIKAGDCIPFFGSGVGCQAGLPDWNTVVHTIEERILTVAAQQRKKTQTKAFLREANNLSIVEHFRKLVSQNEYEEFLLERFGVTTSPSRLHELIAQIPCPFFITTNFDPLFEGAYHNIHEYLPLVCTRHDQVVSARATGRSFLIKLHGCIQDLSTIVFSQRDYDEFQVRQQGLLDYVRTLLDASVILFVGYSFTDPDFENLIGRSTVLTAGSRRDDYAIFRRLNGPQVDLLRDRGIQVLNVQEYDHIPDIFDAIHSELGATSPAPAVPSTEEDDISALVSSFHDAMIPALLPFASPLPEVTDLTNQIFVPRRVNIRQQAGQSGSAEVVTEATLTLPDDLVEFQASSRKTLLTGEPGCGKTVLMSALVVRGIALDDGSLYALIRLRELVSMNTDPIMHLASLAAEFHGTELSVEEQHLRQLLVSTKSHFYFDGFDEVDPRLRGHVAREIEDLLAQFDGLSVVVSTRPLTGDYPLHDFILTRFAPLSSVEALALIDNISRQLPDATCSVEKASDTITRFPYIGMNPLLVTCLMLAKDICAHTRLSATEVTSAALDVLIRRGLLRTQDERPVCSETDFRMVLARAAFRLWLDGQTAGAPSTSWEASFGVAAGAAGVDSDPKRLLGIAVDDMGVLRLMGQDSVGFVIRSFHELLVAEVIVSEGAEITFSNQYSDDATWGNVIRFIAVLTSHDKRRQILERTWSTNPTLTLRIVADCDDGFATLPQLVSVENEDEVISLLKSVAFRLTESEVVECIEPLFLRSRRNGHVLYFAVGILEKISESGEDGLAAAAATKILGRFWDEARQHGIVPDFVGIPGGLYRIGDDDGVEIDERPAHNVLLKEFLIGTTLVTNREFKAFAPSFEPGYGSDQDDMPATDLTWYEGMLYSRWITEGRGRLPTEAEWEVSSRGPYDDGRQYPWGNDADPSRANVNRSAGKGTPVKKYPPNDFGLFDTTGNAFEWCHDWHDSTYYENSPLDSPMGPATGRHKAMRGGCWARGWDVARCSYRVRQIPATRDILVGFRVCCPSGTATH